ncbi:urea transporter [Effusibacillus consociatus]|uniref:Urea transporter n=1 Tax=Effusibacillus consociatus TaxID=1117041 RepID=A0ABV9PWW8_9BACL
MGKKVLLDALSSIAQILFINRPIAGGIFLIGISAYSSLMAFTCFLGAMAANFAAAVTKRCPDKIKEGLYGFNGALIGLAFPVFLPHTALLWVLVIVGAGLTTLLYEIFSSRLRISPLTFPYVLLTWLAIFLMDIKSPAATCEVTPVWEISVLGMGQIFFLESILSGLFILVGISLVSWREAVWTWSGALIGSLPALWTGHFSVSLGLISLNTALLVLGFLRFRPEVNKLFILVFAVLAVFIFQFLYNVLSYFSLPTLTFPFIFSMWIGTACCHLLFKKPDVKHLKFR